MLFMQTNLKQGFLRHVWIGAPTKILQSVLQSNLQKLAVIC